MFTCELERNLLSHICRPYKMDDSSYHEAFPEVQLRLTLHFRNGGRWYRSEQWSQTSVRCDQVLLPFQAGFFFTLLSLQTMLSFPFLRLYHLCRTSRVMVPVEAILVNIKCEIQILYTHIKKAFQ
jgi:hypothetical protein